MAIKMETVSIGWVHIRLQTKWWCHCALHHSTVQK